MCVCWASFVGHSLGGLIVRAAVASKAFIPHLTKLYTFISLGSPHLGYLYHDNSIFESGAIRL